MVELIPLAAFQNISDEDIEQHLIPLPQVECSVIHRFGPGLYIREVHIPAGTFAIGHYQRYEQMNVMLKGRVTILKDDGSTGELIAPMQFVGKPGRKIGLIREDMIWQNVYATTETNIKKLEEEFLDKSDTTLDCESLRLKLSFSLHNADRKDYELVLAQFGINHDAVKSQVENDNDLIDLSVDRKFLLDASSIHGKGLFATSNISAGETIFPARVDFKRTIAGRYTNHSLHPNAQMVLLENGNVNGEIFNIIFFELFT